MTWLCAYRRVCENAWSGTGRPSNHLQKSTRQLCKLSLTSFVMKCILRLLFVSDQKDTLWVHSLIWGWVWNFLSVCWFWCMLTLKATTNPVTSLPVIVVSWWLLWGSFTGWLDRPLVSKHKVCNNIVLYQLQTMKILNLLVCRWSEGKRMVRRPLCLLEFICHMTWLPWFALRGSLWRWRRFVMGDSIWMSQLRGLVWWSHLILFYRIWCRGFKMNVNNMVNKGCNGWSDLLRWILMVMSTTVLGWWLQRMLFHNWLPRELASWNTVLRTAHSVLCIPGVFLHDLLPGYNCNIDCLGGWQHIQNWMQLDDFYNSGKQQRAQRRHQKKYGDVSDGSYGCFLCCCKGWLLTSTKCQNLKKIQANYLSLMVLALWSLIVQKKNFVTIQTLSCHLGVVSQKTNKFMRN